MGISDKDGGMQLVFCSTGSTLFACIRFVLYKCCEMISGEKRIGRT